MEINDITKNNIRERTPVRVFLLQGSNNPFIGKHFQKDSFTVVGQPLKGIYDEYFITVEECQALNDTLSFFNEYSYKLKKGYDHSNRNSNTFSADMVIARVETHFKDWKELFDAISNQQVYFAGLSKLLRLQTVHIAVLSEDVYQRILSNDYALKDGRRLSQFDSNDKIFNESLFVIEVLKEAGYPLKPFEYTYEGLNHSSFQQKIIDIEKEKSTSTIKFEEDKYLLFKWSELSKKMQGRISEDNLLTMKDSIINHWAIDSVLFVHKNDITEELYRDNSDVVFYINEIKDFLSIDHANIAIDFFN